MPKDNMYIPLHLGSEGSKEIHGFQKDNDGESISIKNPFFCELTGLYWAWKNLDAKYIGLVHYRRHLTTKNLILTKKEIGSLESESKNEKRKLAFEKLCVDIFCKSPLFLLQMILAPFIEAESRIQGHCPPEALIEACLTSKDKTSITSLEKVTETSL